MDTQDPSARPSIGLVIYRWIVAAMLIGLGIYGCARVALELEQAGAPWRDWLALMMTAVPLAFGVAIAMFAGHGRPPPFVRKGAARIFGSAWLGAMLVSGVLIRMLKQNSLTGASAVLAGALMFWFFLAILYGAINGDIEEREKRSN